MIIGVRAHDYGKRSAADLFAAIAKDGWKTVQLAFPKAIDGVGSFDDVTPEIVDETKSALTCNGMGVAVLGVYVDPSLIDQSRRKEQIRLLLQALPHAKALGAGCIGTETSVRGDFADLHSLYLSLEELLPDAESLGVNIGIEPVHRHTLHTPELTRKMLRDFPSRNLRIIFDPLNLLTPDTIGEQNDLWKRCIGNFGEYITAIHIKGASRELDGNGMLADVPFAASILDHEALFTLLRPVDAPILREGASPAEAAEDIAFIERYLT